MSAHPLRELTGALQRLHRQAGEPSTHVIGKAINYSHTTVAQALKGSRCPSWAVTEAITSYFGGDLDEIRACWVAVRDAQDPLPAMAPARDLGGKPAEHRPSESHESNSNPGSGGERVVLRWKTRLETIEFLDEGLALEWIKARLQMGEGHE